MAWVLRPAPHCLNLLGTHPAVQLRERRALRVLHASYTARLSEGQSKREAWLAVGPLAVDVGRAHAERWVFESLLKDNMSCPDTSLRPHLDNLRCLYVTRAPPPGFAVQDDACVAPA